MVYYYLRDDLERFRRTSKEIKNNIDVLLDDLRKNVEESKKLGENYEIQLKKLHAMESEMKNMSLKKSKMKVALKELNFKLNEINNIFENTKIIDRLAVDDEKYGLSNGLVDLNRDVLMKLIIIINNDEKIINIIGMTGLFFTWSKKKTFCWARTTKGVTPPFRADLVTVCGYTLTHSSFGTRCAFGTSDSYQTIFLNKILTKSVFRWTVRINYSPTKDSFLRVGASPPDLLDRCRDVGLGVPKGTCSFWFCAMGKGESGTPTLGPILLSELEGVEGKSDIPQTETPVSDGSCVAIEADLVEHSLCFFVDGKIVPRAVSHVSTSLCLGVSGYGSPSFTSMYFYRLEQPTTPSALSAPLILSQLTPPPSTSSPALLDHPASPSTPSTFLSSLKFYKLKSKQLFDI